MTNLIYHILNGDALRERFPNLLGEQIVMRECLVEGAITGNSLEEFFKIRAQFFTENYQVSQAGYMQKSASEINKLVAIGKNAEVFLWFENDLFCQVNLWFVIYTLIQINPGGLRMYLVSPFPDSWNGFGALDDSELLESFENKKLLSAQDQSNLCGLWVGYQIGDFKALKKYASKLTDRIDHIEQVIEAHIDRFPSDSQQFGRPQRSLLNIIEEFDKPTFPKVFKAFCKKEGIYGFGDTQVKHLLKDLNQYIH